jgi:thiol-disulfide isomerase/thioredoxin
MRKIALTTVAFCLMVLIPVQAINENGKKGIKFRDITFENALKVAKKEKKIVFMDCYTTWCGPCKYLSEKIFIDDKVGEFYNEHFVSVKFDMEAGEGITIKNRYGIKSFPTLLFIEPDGTVRHKEVGSCSAEKLIERGKNALSSDKNYKYLSEKIQTGVYSTEDLKMLLTMDRRYPKADSLVIVLFERMSDKDFVCNETMSFGATFINDIESPILKRIIEHETEFKELMGFEFYKYLHQIFYMYVARNNSIPGYTLKKVTQYGHSTGINAYYDYELEKIHNALKKKPADEELISLYIELLEDWLTIRKPGPTRLNNQVIYICDDFSDSRIINKADDLVKQSYLVDKTMFWAYHSNAYVHYKKGKLKEAIELEEKALNLALKTHPNDTYSIDTFRKMLEFLTSKNN